MVVAKFSFGSCFACFARGFSALFVRALFVFLFAVFFVSCTGKNAEKNTASAVAGAGGNSADGVTGAADTDASGQDGAKPGLLVGFSQIGSESAWRVRNSQSMQEAASEMGIQLLYANAEQKQENQIKAIRSFIVYQVDVIVFVPIVQHGWENVLREAVFAGIPVIVADRKLRLSSPQLVSGFVGPDNFEEGRNAARFLLRKYESARSPLTIFEMRGTDGSSVSEDRAVGFREIIGADSRFRIVHSESGDFLRSKGRELVSNFIRERGGFVFDGKPIDILFSHNDGMTLGAIEIFEAHGIQPGTDVTIVTVDAEQAAIDALKAGKVNCVVECNPNFGKTVLSLAQKLARGDDIDYYTVIDEQVFTEFENHDSLPPRGY